MTVPNWIGYVTSKSTKNKCLSLSLSIGVKGVHWFNSVLMMADRLISHSSWLDLFKHTPPWKSRLGQCISDWADFQVRPSVQVPISTTVRLVSPCPRFVCYREAPNENKILWNVDYWEVKILLIPQLFHIAWNFRSSTWPISWIPTPRNSSLEYSWNSSSRDYHFILLIT